MARIKNPTTVIISGGVSLEQLSNPAAATDILTGKEAYGDDGVKIIGTLASGGATPTQKYTLTEVIADPTKIDWNCFWVDDVNLEFIDFAAAVGAPSSSSYYYKLMCTCAFAAGGSLNIYANYQNGQYYGFGDQSNSYTFSRYGNARRKYFNYFPLSRAITSITIGSDFAAINETVRSKITDHIFCGTI